MQFESFNIEDDGSYDEHPFLKELEKMMDEATIQQTVRLETDPEWSRKEYTHVHTIMEAWAVGVLSSYAYYEGYELPDNFGTVFSHIGKRLAQKYPGEAVPQISLVEIKQMLGGWARECPEYIAWNDLPGSQFTSRYSPMATGPEFIDLSVPPHNAALYIREKRRHDKAFDNIFEKEHGRLPFKDD